MELKSLARIAMQELILAAYPIVQVLNLAINVMEGTQIFVTPSVGMDESSFQKSVMMDPQIMILLSGFRYVHYFVMEMILYGIVPLEIPQQEAHVPLNVEIPGL